MVLSRDMTSRTRVWILIVLVGLAASASACLSRPVVEPKPGAIAPTLAMSTYYEEGSQVAVIVGVRPTLSRRERPFIPIEIAVVNKGVAKLTLTPESFTLVDAEGRRFPLAAAAELTREYGSTDLDRRLGEVGSILRRKYLQYDRIRSNFTPGFDMPIGSTDVVLYRFSYLVDMLYFPNPRVPTPDGPFDLLVRVPELAEPLVIRFLLGRPS